MLKKLVNVLEVVALVAAALVVIMLFANEPDDGGGNTAAADPGAEIYGTSCAGCHGNDGGGNVGPQLSGGAVVEAFPDEADQIVLVTEGRGAMPAFGDQLSPEEIAAVVAYTRTL